MNDDLSVRAVLKAADAAVPRVAGTMDMSGTLKCAQQFMRDYGATQAQLDRWDHPSGFSVEIGYAHGEVWYRGWDRRLVEGWPSEKRKATSLHPNDLQPLSELFMDIMGYAIEDAGFASTVEDGLGHVIRGIN